MKKVLPLFFIGVITLLFFWQFLLKGLLPIPSDTIIGLYHPFRDLYVKDYPNGIPFKNFLITDPIRQQYPWRELVISIEKKLQLPVWNPYLLAGTPLIANFQSAAFYPFNLFFFLIPFNYAWSILVVLQPLLAALFIYLYLSNLGVKKFAGFLGAMVFSFSGFSIAWLEWNTIFHTILWLPLIMLAKDKLINKLSVKWITILIFAEVSAIFAGHLQTLFYTLIISNAYLIFRLIQTSSVKSIKKLIKDVFLRYRPFLLIGVIVFTITAIQWVPTLQLISQSARDIDQANWQQAGWFIPWQHLLQFVAPDFFGNPTTLNYWGVWNYGEFIGYVGILPLILALFALFFRHDRKTLFFGVILFLSLLFSLPTFLAKIPYLLNIPFMSTAQPTRLLVLTDFSLAILVAFGFDYFLKSKQRKIIYPIICVGGVILLLWLFIFIGYKNFKDMTLVNIVVSKQNLYLPTILFVVSTILILISLFSKFINKFKLTAIIPMIIIGVVIFDLFRFGWKFTPFTNQNYLFPNTKVIKFLQEKTGNYRIMTTDSRILPPNFSMVYRLQSIDGYDPLYLRRYAELIAASERGNPDISPPFGFNRIITPHNYDSKIIDLLGVKYILSLNDISSSKLVKVFQEGQTRVYENKNAMPRVFFVEAYEFAYGKKEEIETIFTKDIDLRHIAIIQTDDSKSSKVRNQIIRKPTITLKGNVKIIKYSENKVLMRSETNKEALLVFTDTFFSTWNAKVDNIETKIHRTNYNFRGIFIPKGKHNIEFYTTLF